MTTDAILGTYSDFKLVKTRSVVQVVIEVPLERAHQVTDLFGLPQPGAEVMIGMARLRPEAIVEQIKDHRPAKLSQLAGILCNEGAFQTFLTENGHVATNPQEAAEQLRFICGAIGSRRELDTNSYAGAKFRDLKADYQIWLKVPA